MWVERLTSHNSEDDSLEDLSNLGESVNMHVITNLDSELLHDSIWDSFVSSSPYGHLLQTSLWAELKSRFGWTVERVAVTHRDEIVAGAQVLFRPLPLGFTLAYIPKGPLVNWSDKTTSSILVSSVRQAAQRRRAFFLKLEPDLPDSSERPELLGVHRLHPSPQVIQPQSSIIIDLDREEKDILACAKSKTRYNIRLASRKGIVIRHGTIADLPAFHSLLEQTARRNAFAVHDASYYRAAYDLFVTSGHGQLLLATYQESILAGIMIFEFGRKAWYMYGASSNEHRNRMPNHLLQWEAIRWAKDKGCLIYDLWGIPDEVGKSPNGYIRTTTERTDGLWGVYRFKQGFGGRVVRYAGAYDDIYHPSVYWLYKKVIPLLDRGAGETWHRRFRPG
jgi:lipid II:glycine glycyltransferase (peptidoglycan interpeptide bridge formation enzyme)